MGNFQFLPPVIIVSASPLSTIVYAWNVKAYGTESTPHTNIVKWNKNIYNKQLMPPGPALAFQSVKSYSLDILVEIRGIFADDGLDDTIVSLGTF